MAGVESLQEGGLAADGQTPAALLRLRLRGLHEQSLLRGGHRDRLG